MLASLCASQRVIFTRVLLLAAMAWLAGLAPTPARATPLEEAVSAVVRIKTFINSDSSSIANLGRSREGSGIVIDADGLVLTIGYLMVEAHAAEVVANDGKTVPATIVGYDHETGFGLLRTMEPLKIKPLAFGKASDVKEQDPLLAASYGGAQMVLPVHVVSKREFAGAWEYLIDGALFTMPPHPTWSGAALINREGKLVGVGSLFVGDARGESNDTPGNMFVPIDLLMPVMGELLANGRITGPGRPWIGLNVHEVAGTLIVGRVTPGSPAEQAGVKRGDIISGIGSETTRTLPDFYRKLWSSGQAGVSVPLDVTSRGEKRRIDIKSVNRLDTLKLKSTF